MIKHTYFKQIISLLCVFTLVLSIPVFNQTEAQAETKTKKSSVIVSMGDSYSSGEGIEEFYGQGENIKNKVKNNDWLAHRSKNAWSGQLTLNGITKMSADKYDAKTNPDGNWFFVASSGAETKHITEEPQKKPYKKLGVKDGSKNLPEQIKVFDLLKKKGKEADYVTLTIGGNDAGFKDVLTAVIHPSYLLPNVVYHRIKKSYYNKKNEIMNNIRKTCKKISEEAGKQACIIVAGYPKLLDKKGKGKVVNKYEAKDINNAVDDFNNSLEALVIQCQSEMNIEFVPVDTSFDNHEAYSDKSQKTAIAKNQKQSLGKGEFINRIVWGHKSEDLETIIPASAYSMHPNLRGAEAYRNCVQKKINELEKEKKGNDIKKAGSIKNENEKALKNKIKELIKKYDIASNLDLSKTTNAYDSNSEWTYREGIISAKLTDLDCDGTNELVVVRLIGGKPEKDSENLELQVYYGDNGSAKSAGTEKLFTGDDLTEKNIDSIIYKIKNKRYILFENDYSPHASDAFNMNYFIFDYQNHKLRKRIQLYSENNPGLHYKWTEKKWDGGKTKERDIYKNTFNAKTGKNTVTGQYKNSKNPEVAYLTDFGFGGPVEKYNNYFNRFFKAKYAVKLFEFSLIKRFVSENIKYESSLKDYTNLSSSKYNNIGADNKQYTAEEVIKMPAKKIVRMMGSDYSVTKGSIETFYYISDYDRFPGMDFYFMVDFNNKKPVKSLVQHGNFRVYAIEVSGNGIGCNYNKNPIKANYDFKKCSELLGKIECKGTGGAVLSGALGAVGYTIEKNDVNITLNFTADQKLMMQVQTDGSSISYDTMLQENPKLKNIVVNKQY